MTFNLMVSSMTPAERKTLTVLVQDANNPNVKWEMGLVSARAIHIGPGTTDYQVVWRVPRGAIRGSVVVKQGVIAKGSLAYFDPKIFEETKQDWKSWVWEHFETHEEFLAVSQKVAKKIEELPIHEIPTIEWSDDCRTTTRRLG
ncbi:MAG: hypothetical protein WC869_00205 [Phycisphaerae bacterium]